MSWSPWLGVFKKDYTKVNLEDLRINFSDFNDDDIKENNVENIREEMFKLNNREDKPLHIEISPNTLLNLKILFSKIYPKIFIEDPEFPKISEEELLMKIRKINDEEKFKRKLLSGYNLGD